MHSTRAPHSPAGYPPLRPFVRWLLAPLGLSAKTLDVLTDEAGMRVFQRAFTHQSVDPRCDHNYERLEWVGDTLVNDAVASYVYRKYPWTHGWMTLIKHRIIQTKGLGRFAQNLQFLPHIRVSAAKLRQIKTTEKYRLRLLEDVFEAFIGACREVFVAKGGALCATARPRAGAMMGTALVGELLFQYLDAPNLITVASDWEAVKDAKSRAKELYSRLGWPELPTVLKARKRGNNFFEAVLPAFPRERRGAALVYTATGATIAEAERAVAWKAMDDLTRNYGLKESIPPHRADSKPEKM